MAVQFTLNVVTMIMCIVTLTMASAALMPQIKQGLVILREGLLWTILLGVIGLVGVIGWARLHDIRQGHLGIPESTEIQPVEQPIGSLPKRRSAPVEALDSDLVTKHTMTASQSWRNTRSNPRLAAPSNPSK